MQVSKIQLDHYYLSGLSYSVNPDFDPEADVKVKLADIAEEHDIQPLDGEEQREWQVELQVSFSPSDDGNAPYSFSANIVGLFSVHESIAAEKRTSIINVNATSVLYSTLREIIYSITAKGPFFPLLLPTLCFYEQKNEEKESDEKADTEE